jgi:ABC-type branched-subunit amino acid transport system permease subunit
MGDFIGGLLAALVVAPIQSLFEKLFINGKPLPKFWWFFWAGFCLALVVVAVVSRMLSD